MLAGLRASAVLSRRLRGRPPGARARPVDSLVGALVGGLVAALAMVAIVPARGTAELSAEIADPMAVARRSTLRVVGEGCGGRASGSGFVVQDGAVLTNAHVVAGLRNIEVWTESGRRHPATLAVFDARRDLAVLRVAQLDVPRLEPSPSPAEPSHTVSIHGYPGSSTDPTSVPSEVNERTTVSAVDIYGRPQVEKEVLFVAADLLPGMSGGPVVDAHGRYVGAAFAAGTTAASKGSGFALTANEVRQVVQAYAVDPKATAGPTACVTRPS